MWMMPQHLFVNKNIMLWMGMINFNLDFDTFYLLGNQLTDGCAQCLIEGLKNNSSVTSLDLSNNDFGEKGGIYIGDAIVSILIDSQ